MFLQPSGAPSSSSLLASAVFPAFAASQSTLAVEFSSIGRVAMLSDVQGGRGGGEASVGLGGAEYTDGNRWAFGGVGNRGRARMP